MRSLPVEFLEVVEDDLRYARNFYDSWQFQGAARFHERFRETVRFAGRVHPESIVPEDWFEEKVVEASREPATPLTPDDLTAAVGDWTTEFRKANDSPETASILSGCGPLGA